MLLASLLLVIDEKKGVRADSDLPAPSDTRPDGVMQLSVDHNQEFTGMLKWLYYWEFLEGDLEQWIIRPVCALTLGSPQC